MGCCQTKQETRVNPKGVNTETTPEEQEGISKERTCTDTVFLVIIAAFVIVLIGLLAYCMLYGDIHRIIDGYDDCGNVCGHTNTRYDNLGCSGADRTNEKFLLVDPSPSNSNPNLVHRTCVEGCDGRADYRTVLNRCLPITYTPSGPKKLFFSKIGFSDFFQEVSEDLETCWKEILYLCLLSFVASILMVLAFTFIAGAIVWLVLVGIVIALLCGTIFLWIQYKYATEVINQDEIAVERKISYLVFAIILTIATVCTSCIIIALRNRINLVIELFKEAGKALTRMPALILEPLLTFLALAFFASLWLYFAIIIESSGILIMEANQSALYVKDTTMKVTRWYNLLALFWFVNFVIGCQHMVIAGAVATWFFTRNKAKLSAPVVKSFNNLVRYHLGTVAKGSFFIALVNLIRALVKSLKYTLRNPSNSATKILDIGCQCCFYVFDKFLQYLTRNAYIETAIYGDNFCTAGKRAFNILSNNALRVFCINSVGDFVLILAKAFVVVITILVGIEFIQKKDGVYHNWLPLVIAGIFAYLISHCFISVYEMAIDTIFICFCEDCEMNDGINKPYYMSRGLMEFVQNSKKVLRVEDKKSEKAWSVDNTTKPAE